MLNKLTISEGITIQNQNYIDNHISYQFNLTTNNL